MRGVCSSRIERSMPQPTTGSSAPEEVSESPWAMVTDAQGNASFEGVPDGATRVKV
jgi:hypothetical protein